MKLNQKNEDSFKKLNQAFLGGKAGRDEVLDAGGTILEGSTTSNNINGADNTVTDNGTIKENKTEIGGAGTAKINPKEPINKEQIDGGLDYNNPNNEEFVFRQMVAGEPVAGGGIATDGAKKRWEQYNNVSALSYQQIGDSIINGTLNQYGTDITDIKNMNPELYSKVSEYMQNKKTLDDINKVGSTIYNGLTKGKKDGDPYAKYKIEQDSNITPTTFDKYNKQLEEKIKAKFGDNSSEMFSITQKIMDNPEMKMQANKVAELEGEKLKIQQDMDNIGDDVRKVLGSEAPEELESAYIAQQTRRLQKSLTTKNNELSVEQAKLDTEMKQVDMVLDAFYEGMKMDSAEAKAKSSGSGGGGGGTSTAGYDRLFSDMLSGNFSGSFTATNMKKYGLGPTTKDGIISWIGNNKTIEDIARLKNNVFFSEKDIEKMKTLWGTNKAMIIKEILDSGLSEIEQNKKIKEIILKLPKEVRKSILKGAGLTNMVGWINSRGKGILG